MAGNTNTTEESDHEQEIQLLAKASAAEVKSEASGEEESGVTRQQLMKQALMQFNFINACSHALKLL